MLLVLFFNSISALNVSETEIFQFLNVKAAPTLFGYSDLHGSELFPDFYYPKCQSNSKNSIFINYTTNAFTYTCTSPKSFVVIGPTTKATIANPPVTSYFVQKSDIASPIQITSKNDFAIGWCNHKEGTSATDFFLSPRFQKNSYFSTLKSMKKTGKKPLLLLFITPDSLSRNHFYRKLPETLKFFQNIQGYHVFDFLLHNIIGADTSENQMRVFGETWVKQFSGSQNIDFHGENAIWSILKNLGFMTLWGTDACADNVPKSMGRVPNIDHVVNLFFCAQYVYGNYRAAKQLLRQQRCMGSQMPHSYLMEYSLNFTKLYPNVNQWIYNHFTAGHEGSGQHAQTLDEDLKEYIGKYVEMFNSTHEIIVFLAADHGMRYGDYMSDRESIQEHRLPGFFMIASDQLLREIPNSLNTLEINRFRLNTKPDLRKTMISLAGGYMSTDKKYFNLFTEEIPKDRTCEQAGIPIWYCSTYVPQSLNVNSELVIEVSRRIIMFINENSYQNYEAPLGFFCQKVGLKEVKSANLAKISEKRYTVRVIFNLAESQEAEFDAVVELNKTPGDPIIFEGEKLYTTVVNLGRIDKHRNPCESSFKQTKIQAEYCICAIPSILI